MAAGNIAAAEETISAALAVDPSDIEALFARAQLLLRRNRADQAMPLMVRLMTTSDVLHGRALAWRELGMASLLTDRVDPALDAFRTAVSLSPDNVDHQRLLGLTLLASGRKGEATDVLREVVNRTPGSGLAWLGLAQTGSMDAAEMVALEAIYQRVPADENGTTLAFARAIALANGDDPAVHFAAMAEANRRKQARQPWTWDIERPYCDAPIEDWERTLASYAPPFARPGPVRPLPVLVVGMPRSGSTLLERMLAAHPAITPGGESAAFLRTLEEVGRGPWSKRTCRRTGELYWKHILAGRSDLPPGGPEDLVMVDKNLANFRFLGLVRLALPEARVIHITRDSRDIALSCYEQFFAPGRVVWSYSLETIGHYMALYDRQMARWRARLGGGAWLDLAYEDLVADPESAMRRVIDWIGLPWDPAVLSHQTANVRATVTASLGQATEAVHTRSKGRGARYEAYLAPVFAARDSLAADLDP